MDTTEYLTTNAAKELAESMPSLRYTKFGDLIEDLTKDVEGGTAKEASEYVEMLTEMGIAVLTKNGRGVLISLPALLQFEQQLMAQQMAAMEGIDAADLPEVDEE